MKTFFTCILFSVYCSISVAQNYVPFSTSNAVWRGQRSGINGGNLEWIQLEYNQAITGDTMINGIVYHQLKETSIEYLYNLNPHYLISITPYGTYYIGAFREDSLKRIYYLQTGSTNEVVLYDFNLTVGDTLLSSLAQVNLIVTEIDSFFDGAIFRKKYYFDVDTLFSTPPIGFLIEGVGANTGFNFWLPQYFEDDGLLYCFRENNIIKYTDSTNNCSLVNIKENQFPQSSFTLSPNPTTEILNLKSEKSILFPLKLFVMDMQGKLITQKIIHNNDDLSLNVKSFANGTYLLTIKNKESVLFRGIFAKQ